MKEITAIFLKATASASFYEQQPSALTKPPMYSPKDYCLEVSLGKSAARY